MQTHTSDEFTRDNFIFKVSQRETRDGASTLSERRRWGETWETPAGTILSRETTEVPGLPSLDGLDKKYEKLKNDQRIGREDAFFRESATNLEPSGASRAARRASEPLSRPPSPTLCWLSPHSSLAGGGNNLKTTPPKKCLDSDLLSKPESWNDQSRTQPCNRIITGCQFNKREMLVNLHKQGGSTVPPPGAETWRTVLGGRCVSQNTASLYSHHLFQPKMMLADKQKNIQNMKNVSTKLSTKMEYMNEHNSAKQWRINQK